MKTSNMIALSAIGIALAVTSCKKEKTVTPQEATPVQSGFSNANVQALRKNLSTPVEVHTINATSGGVFYGAKGTKVIVAPSAFLKMNNQAVTGNVTIQFKEALNKKDMILNNATPMSNGNILVSGGEVFFSAWQGSQKLKINPASNGVNINIPVQGTPSNQMRLFYANGGSDLSNSNLNWYLASASTSTGTPSDSVSVYQDSVGSYTYYGFYPDSISFDSLSWANCDYFWNDPNPTTNLTFNLTGQFDNSNTTLYLSLNGNNVLVPLYPSSYSTLTQLFNASNIPVNKNFTLVAISYIGGNYYYGSQPVTTSANLVVNVPALSASSISQINSNLTNLP